MKNIGQRLILISFILAAIASISVFVYLKSLKTPISSINKITIYVAVDTIKKGTLIKEKMIKKLEIDNNLIFNDYIKRASDIVGKYTKETIDKNQGFHSDDLIDKDENKDELSFKINNNYRAVAVNVSSDSGVADLIKPGDYVDVIVYLSEKKDGKTVIRPDLTKTVLQDAEVLAVDKQLTRDAADAKDDGKIPTTFLVTVAVKVDDVEKIILAEDIGSLKLVLRPVNNHKINKLNETTVDELISVSNKNSSASKSKIKAAVKKAASKIANKSASKSSSKYIQYKVKKGDTLRNISRFYYGVPDKYTMLKKVNNIQDENNIPVGLVIRIPVLK